MRLGVHPVVGLEEGPRERDERAIAWVIEGFDAGNPLGKMRLGLLDIPHELSFGIRRARYQYRTCLGDSLRNALEELAVYRRMAAVAGIRFVMDMLVGMRTAHRHVINIRCIELKHLRLAMINPYDRMIVATHGANREAACTGAQDFARDSRATRDTRSALCGTTIMASIRSFLRPLMR